MQDADDTSAMSPAGWLCLDFTNTVEDHASDEPEETLHAYSDLAAWARRRGIAAEREAAALRRVAAERPVEARLALTRAVALREAIYRIFVARIHGQAPTAADLDTLNGVLSQLAPGPRVALAEGSFAWEWPLNRESLDWPSQVVALSAAELLTSGASDRVGQCADEHGCGWLFLDTSRNRSRRWCSMGDCGNRAKQRRHTQRLAATHQDTQA